MIRSEAQDANTYAQFAIAKYFDKSHRSPIGVFKVDDLVYINVAKKGGKGYEIAGVNCYKLGPQQVSPYCILEVLKNGCAVKLDLPPSSTLWPVISCLHLEKAPPNLWLDQSPPIIVHDPDTDWDNEESEVKTIFQRRGTSYLVKWKEYPIE